ncbi:hypothetical protein [Phenylobacterium sp.]|uniref:hypothetical protein n=1 Tax=Phenylobacterium sp. TaxID=1871053 RepID=UPI003BACA488
MTHIDPQSDREPYGDFHRGYVAGLSRASVALADFISGDGPSTIPIPQHTGDIVEMARRLIGALLNRTDELEAADRAGNVFPEALHRYVNNLQEQGSDREEIAYRLEAQRVSLARDTPVRAILDRACPRASAEDGVPACPAHLPCRHNVVSLRDWVAGHAASGQELEALVLPVMPVGSRLP